MINDKKYIVCIDNVEYIVLKNYNHAIMLGHFKQDGTLYACE